MILVTGSAGYIGSHLTHYFEKNKIDYIGIDNLSYSYKTNVLKKNKHFFTDISNKKKIKKILKTYKPKTVIHAAAASYVLEAEQRKTKYFLNNIIKTKQFINLCKDSKVKNFIFLSSSNVYKETIKSNSLNEKSLTAPKNYYGKNKLLIEKYLKKKKFENLIILRLFNVIGIFNKNFKSYRFKKKNFQRLIFKIIENNKYNKKTKINFINKNGIIVFPKRDFVSILDLSKIIFKIIKKIISIYGLNETFNIGSGKAISISYLTKILSLIEPNLNLDYVKISRKELIYTKASIKKLTKFINYKPKTDLKKIIKSHYKKYIN